MRKKLGKRGIAKVEVGEGEVGRKSEVGECRGGKYGRGRFKRLN